MRTTTRSNPSARRHLAVVMIALTCAPAMTLACGSNSANNAGSAAVAPDRTSQGTGAQTKATSSPGTLQLPKAALQSTLDGLFTEHVTLVLGTTGATAAGQTAQADQTRQQLDKNTDDIVGAVVGVYGPDGAVFGQGWKMHVQAFVDYAAAGAKKDDAKKAEARDKLEKYPKQVGSFLASANPNLSQQAVADLVATHIGDITGLIDQQVSAGANATDATQNAGHASAHMTDLATALTNAISQQFPARFPS